MIRSAIIGCGSYTPENVVKNADLEGIVETSDEWIVQRTGIRQRHIAVEGETTADLGEKAARAALKHAGVTIDGSASATMDRDYDGITVHCIGGQWLITQRKSK